MRHGRGEEERALEQLLSEAVEGRSGSLVIQGTTGIGKSALLDHAVDLATARGIPVLRSTGVETEAELPYAALHLTLRPALGRLHALPGPQADQLRCAFGLARQDDTADWFLIGLATLSLLAGYADDGPLLCVVDDAHWLDYGSREALLFAARRLDTEGVVVLMATRHDGLGEHDLDHLTLRGLDDAAAAAVLTEAYPGLAPHVRQRVLTESEGNPLALRELPAALTPEQRAGLISPVSLHVDGRSVTSRVQEAMRRQLATLPPSTQQLLTVAAADDTGEFAIVAGAGRELGLDPAELAPAEHSGLIELADRRVVFRHPLVRAAVYRAADVTTRMSAHRGLAATLTGHEHVDRRAWHLAATVTGPDEKVAIELEKAAERAQSRGGFGAMAAAYRAAARLTRPTDTAARVRRLGSAALAAHRAGELSGAHHLADDAASLTTDPRVLADLAPVRAWAERQQGNVDRSVDILVDAAAPIAERTPQMAAPLLVQAAWNAVLYDRPGRDTFHAVVGQLTTLRLEAESTAAPFVQHLVGRDQLYRGEVTGGLHHMREASDALKQHLHALPPEQQVWAAGACGWVEDDAAMLPVLDSLARQLRDRGALCQLPIVLVSIADQLFWRGHVDDAGAIALEAQGLARDTGQHQCASWASRWQALPSALAGHEEECRSRAQRDVTPMGIETRDGDAVRTLSLLDLGLGRYEAVLDRIEAHRRRSPVVVPALLAIEIEASVRLGRVDGTADRLRQLQHWTTGTRQSWSRAAALRCEALLCPTEEADELYRAASDVHASCLRPFERARTELLHGEWLRRRLRRTDARRQLRAAHDSFRALGATPWADRAAAELRAAGEAIGPPDAIDPIAALTAQELRAVRLAADGMSNRDIAGQLFLSPRTVAYHLYKAYPKLGVASRTELIRLGLGTVAGEERPG